MNTISVKLEAGFASGGEASAQIQWAMQYLAETLARCGVALTEADSASFTVRVTDPASVPALEGLSTSPESFALQRAGTDILVWSADDRGLVYALTELADRATNNSGDLSAGPFPHIGKPANKVRSITRIFANEKEDKGWFHDKSHWIDYLTMLATNRFNRFSLTLGIQYDYPYHNDIISDVYLHFPYPYLLDLPGYDIKVLELSAAERDTNLEMLKFIGREAARRGLDFQLGLWTQRYDFDDVPNATYTVQGVTDANLGPYCRDAIGTLLREIPEITGMTFRIHVEGGISEGDYDFWRTAFDGIKSAGRPIEIDMHAKGLDETTLNVALETGMPVAASPKYLAEHIGLSYHTSAIREREYPPAVAVTNREKLSVGSRRFLRQSYGDLLPNDKRWKVIFRVWPGTQRVLAWGDPELAAGYGRSASFCGADGIEWMEPLSMKGRQGTGIPGGRALYGDVRLAERLDWQKYTYQYRLWGRLSYDPAASTETDQSFLRAHCGDAAPLVAEALHSASKVLPLVTQAHGPSIANNAYWPEIYTNITLLGEDTPLPYGFDMDAPLRFGNAPTFDPQMFCNAREYVAGLIEGETDRRYSPLDVAHWLAQTADKVEIAAIKAKQCRDLHQPFTQRLLLDAQVAAGIGRFFAAKFRGACWAELFIATGSKSARRRAVDQLRSAHAAWKGVVSLTEGVYHDDLTFGPGPHLRGNWASRLGQIEQEMLELAAFRRHHQPADKADGDIADKVAAALDSWSPIDLEKAASIAAPQSFAPGKAIAVSVEAPQGASVRLHYRTVDQSKRWQVMDVRVADGKASAEIPATETDGPFNIQFYFSVLDQDRLHLAPGFDSTLSNQPYAVILQA